MPEVEAVPGPKAAEDVPVSRGVAASWEVFAAAGIMVGVLALIDVGYLHHPELVLSCAPFGLLCIAAAVRLRAAHLAVWIGAFVLLGAAMGEWRIACLAFPALVLGFLGGLQRRFRRDA